MTSPQFPSEPLPPRSYTAGDVYDMQNADQESQAAAANADLQASAELTRLQFYMGPHAQIQTATANASTAVSAAVAAANDAANAVEKADIAYAAATEWGEEFVVASAEVLLAGNELLLGPVINVRDGRVAILTDIHIALIEQHAGITIETRIWDVTNTTYRVAHTGTLAALVNRRSYSALTVEVDDRERFWVYVTDIVGDEPPIALQVKVVGVYIDDEP